jgi:hypothetical protein
MAADPVQPGNTLMQCTVAPRLPDEDVFGAVERQRDEPDQKSGGE